LGRGVDVKGRESGWGEEEEDESWGHSGKGAWKEKESDIKLTGGAGFEVV
jgi:hypothetical protein